MPASTQLSPVSRRVALLVLVLALAATAFGFWRERELAQRNQIIRWQDAVSQLQPLLRPLLDAQFKTLPDQEAYFQSCQAQLASLPISLRRLGPDEPVPPRTATQQVISSSGGSGNWRFVAAFKPAPVSDAAPQWIVLACGLGLSLLLYSLFMTQSRLQCDAEMARESEIGGRNRDREQKGTERTAQRNDALAAEKELDRLKSNFISMVTHEIRTPLALILGSSEILSRYFDRLSAEKRAEHLQTIAASAERMNHLLEDVLLLSEAEAGRMELSPVELDLKLFCGQLVDDLLSATARRCPIDLVCNVAGAVRVDEKLLRHILSNLITNAVKYSPPGAPVTLSASRDCDSAIFVVRDRGLGIPEEDRQRLFTPLYRGKNAALTAGAGLGLVIVRHCVERLGGDIEIAGGTEGGTTVTVRLPLALPAHTEFVRHISEGATP